MGRYYVQARSKATKVMAFRVVNKPIFDVDKTVGQCWPDTGDHLIEIDPRQCPQEYLDTLIHEASHEFFPRMQEKTVLNLATSISRLLWRLGYRRVKLRVKRKRRRK